MALTSVTGQHLNADGLLVKYGLSEATAGRGGYEKRFGPTETIEFELNLADLSTSTETVVSDVAPLPKGVYVYSVEVYVITATAGTNSNLDLGWIDLDRSSNGDDDSLIDAGDGWHTAAAGTSETYILGGTEAGTQYGIVTANAKLITAGADTAAFDSGVIRVRINYMVP